MDPENDKPSQTQESRLKNKTLPFNIPSCSLTIDHLAKLYAILEKKADEARQFELRVVDQMIFDDPNRKSQIKNVVEEHFKMYATIWGRGGQFLADCEKTIFEDEDFPDDVSSISYNCYIPFKAAMQQDPQNSFSVQIFFDSTRLLDFSNTNESSYKSLNAARVSGVNATWVSGVLSDIKEFFKDKKSKWRWLHLDELYNLLLIPLLPLSFWISYRIDGAIHITTSNLPSLIKIGIFIPMILFLLYVFRIIFNYARWVYPYIEFDTSRQSRRKAHRKRLWGIIGVVFLPILGDIARKILF